jgi:hypothetical protein
MLKDRLAYVVVAVATSACGSTTTGALEETVASSSEALTATAITGSVYRLNNATFNIFNPAGVRVATVKPAPDLALEDVPLKPGTYTITLASDWILQRQVDSGWVDMSATLASLPLIEFMIDPGEVTELHYAFAAGFNSGVKTPATSPYLDNNLQPGATGTARLSIEVDDCGLYVSKITSLAAFTIDCLGTLDATQYSLANGALVRNFSSCSSGNASALDSIDGILSLQFDRPDLVAQHPKARRDVDINQSYSQKCIAGAWDQWRVAFLASGVNVCPNWQRLSTENPPETGAGAAVQAGLPAYVTDKKTKISSVPEPAPSLVHMEKIAQTYQVSFPSGSPAPNCGTAAACATACAGGFRGFVMSASGPNQVITDPAYWELDTVYSSLDNPFLSTGYYHAMADYGPIPGDQFGHAQRSLAYKDKRGTWFGEPCTYFLDGTRFYTKLIYNKNTTGAVSWCRPPL